MIPSEARKKPSFAFARMCSVWPRSIFQTRYASASPVTVSEPKILQHALACEPAVWGLVHEVKDACSRRSAATTYAMSSSACAGESGSESTSAPALLGDGERLAARGSARGTR